MCPSISLLRSSSSFCTFDWKTAATPTKVAKVERIKPKGRTKRTKQYLRLTGDTICFALFRPQSLFLRGSSFPPCSCGESSAKIRMVEESSRREKEFQKEKKRKKRGEPHMYTMAWNFCILRTEDRILLVLVLFRNFTMKGSLLGRTAMFGHSFE